MGYLSLWPDAEGQPVVSTLNAYDGAATSNMAIVPTLNGNVDAYAFNRTNLIMDISSYFAPILPLRVTTAELPAGTVSYTYLTMLAAAGGVLPYHWNITSGSLPPGLGLDASGGGVISGSLWTSSLLFETSVKTLLMVSSVRVESTWSLRTARMTAEAKRKRLCTCRPAE